MKVTHSHKSRILVPSPFNCAPDLIHIIVILLCVGRKRILHLWIHSYPHLRVDVDLSFYINLIHIMIKHHLVISVAFYCDFITCLTVNINR